MTATTQTLEDQLAEYHRTVAAASDCGSKACEYGNLRDQIENGNTRPWVAEKLAAYGRTPTVEDIANLRAEARELNELAKIQAEAVYVRMLAEGVAFEIVDHSERLASRPFEVRRAERLMTGGGHLAAHGASLRLARYQTREAAERTIERTTESELARLRALSQAW